MFVELHQEAIFFLSALLTCESFGEGEKEKYILSPTRRLICHPSLWACHLCFDLSKCWRVTRRKKGIVLVLEVEYSIFFLFLSSLSASSLSPFGKGGIEGLESQSKHWQWHLIIAVCRYVGSWLTCERQGRQWNTHIREFGFLLSLNSWSGRRKKRLSSSCYIINIWQQGSLKENVLQNEDSIPSVFSATCLWNQGGNYFVKGLGKLFML